MGIFESLVSGRTTTSIRQYNTGLKGSSIVRFACQFVNPGGLGAIGNAIVNTVGIKSVPGIDRGVKLI
jgi:hypothetical protein